MNNKILYAVVAADDQLGIRADEIRGMSFELTSEYLHTNITAVASVAGL